ncbi:hypothetical protein Tco_0436190 [Tanacetum coccineum]
MEQTTYVWDVVGGCGQYTLEGHEAPVYYACPDVLAIKNNSSIEAMSLGCSEVHFVEMDLWVVYDILRPVLEWTGFLDKLVIHSVH